MNPRWSNLILFGAALFVFAMWLCVLGGCSLGPQQVSSGPGETWIVATAGDVEDIERSRATVAEQRGWGWASHLAKASQDGSLSQYVVGPVIYSKRGQREIQVQYAMMSNDVREGLLKVQAQGASTNAREWEDGFVFKITLDEPMVTGYVTVPVLGSKSDRVWITWEATRYDWNNR